MRRVYLPAALLLMSASALMITRVFVGGVRLDTMKPQIRYYVTLQMEATLHGEPATIKTFLPKSETHQTVTTEKVESSRLAYAMTAASPNRSATWSGKEIHGEELATYDAVVQIHPKRYMLPEGTPIPRDYPGRVNRHLGPTPTIQSDAPEIRAAAEEIVRSRGATDLAGTIRALYDFVQNDIAASEYENTLDAVTTLKWGEAFCGGKSRLLVALLRASNIPARLVGGLILTSGSKRITHAWVEAWVNGVWVPFDALNRHFAEHPKHYLILYHGDEALFTRTSDINFRYGFHVKRWRTAPDESLTASTVSFLNPYVFWEAFREAHISVNLLRIILLLPVGVLGVVFFRNVIGVTTFGTFQPALIAVAFRDTGLVWGIVLYVGVLLIGSLVRLALNRIELLHTPRLSILLVFVVTFMLVVTYGSVRSGTLEAASISLFPIAILALTVENFFLTSVEQGPRRAIGVLGQTLLVVTVVFLAIESYFVQALMFLFPEVLLGVIAASLVVGRWTGMRLAEYRRFQPLLAS